MRRRVIVTSLSPKRGEGRGSLAADAIEGGKVKVNGKPAKAAKEIGPGDEIALTAGEHHWVVLVKGIYPMRRPAPEARLLYEETAASLASRISAAEMHKLAPTPGADIKGRPTKRNRRQITRLYGVE